MWPLHHHHHHAEHPGAHRVTAPWGSPNRIPTGALTDLPYITDVKSGEGKGTRSCVTGQDPSHTLLWPSERGSHNSSPPSQTRRREARPRTHHENGVQACPSHCPLAWTRAAATPSSGRRDTPRGTQRPSLVSEPAQLPLATGRCPEGSSAHGGLGSWALDLLPGSSSRQVPSHPRTPTPQKCCCPRVLPGQGGATREM